MKTCKECFAKLMKNGDCIECERFIEEVKPKKKDKPFNKHKGTEAEMFRPEDEGKTWFKVPSPYKAYKNGN